MISREEINGLRRQYPKGTRVVLDRMDDPQAPPKGTKGTVWTVDDVGTIHVKWDNGSSLGVIFGEDSFHKDADEEYAKNVLEAIAMVQADGVKCPRCGRPMEEKLRRNALSRRADIMICSLCGTEEAFEDMGLNKRKPLSEWLAVKIAREYIG